MPHYTMSPLADSGILPPLIHRPPPPIAGVHEGEGAGIHEGGRCICGVLECSGAELKDKEPAKRYNYTIPFISILMFRPLVRVVSDF